jgi:Co/Zn/Cd efflux system component
MKDCCAIGNQYATPQRRVLQVVLWINAAMFVGELAAALFAHSTALLADSVDMLGDAIVYGFSLYAVIRGPAWQARAALLKGAIMGAFGLGVLAEVTVELIRGAMPSADVIGGVGVVALAANALCLALRGAAKRPPESIATNVRRSTVGLLRPLAAATTAGS